MNSYQQGQNGDTPTMADEFIARIDRALNTMAEWPENETMPGTTEQALTAEVDLACDVLTDAEIERVGMPMFGGLAQTERVNIRMPDDSNVTALCSWGEDHIDLAPGRYDGSNWPAMWGIRTILNPWGSPGSRAFDNLAEGSNGSPPDAPAGQPDGSPEALQLDQVLAGG